MARYDDHQLTRYYLSLIFFGLLCSHGIIEVTGKRLNETSLTACQHLRRAEVRRAKALSNVGANVRVPRCNKVGDFETVQCTNYTSGVDCWCVDEYGLELPGTRRESRTEVSCAEPKHCSASSCRMFCPSGFARDAKTGCSICKCRDICAGIECPGGQVCQQLDVKCRNEPCPPIPTCKKARSLTKWCPAGQPLTIADTVRPFLCGTDPGKPTCPPLYDCLVQNGNDYGVCCPNSLKYQKPGICPSGDDKPNPQSGLSCGAPCSHDLECNYMDKCCFSKECQFHCSHPYNVTTCHQAKALSDILAISEREGRGYIPDCNGPGGTFASKQCSRNGLVCWCVDPSTGHKIKGSMGAATTVNCDGVENMIARSLGRSMNMEKCDTNICAAVCEYGFKNDHNDCPTCECSEPCEGFICPMGSHCEVAKDPLCTSGSALCASLPVCKPDLVYSNPCDFGTPLEDNITGEVFYCRGEERRSREFQQMTFFDEEARETRSFSNFISCPENHQCTKLHKESLQVCCPNPPEEQVIPAKDKEDRQQSMCEYLRDFSDRMEGTEEGMQLAIDQPKCTADGSYEARQCTLRKKLIPRHEQRQFLEQNNIRQMKKLFNVREKRQAPSRNLRLYRVDEVDIINTRQMGPIEGRSAKVIDIVSSKQINGGEIFQNDLRKTASAKKKVPNKNEIVEVEVEECWCVDGFGTEIPSSRGFNVTMDECEKLRESLECLDLICRMGCEYGFILDSETKCPACQCRDPCDGVECGDEKECRSVEVSCEDEYCPPVPACLPKKAGQCPFLVPPGSDNMEIDTCSYECRSDAHCSGTKRCCSNGCGTQCVEPQLKTACQHLQTIQMHQASELGIPARQMYIAQCDEQTGKWEEVQCGPDNTCWCVDEHGQELSGTRTKSKRPLCFTNSAFECPLRKCKPCEEGYQIDKNGCKTCECRNMCDDIFCLADDECHLITVECVDKPCPKMPVCMPRRESLCPEGSPLQVNEKEIICGPQNQNESCPTTHTCQLNPMTQRGVCCAKTRDVCFDSIESNCLANEKTAANRTKWKFSPNMNKCVPILVPAQESVCISKNLFHSELACNSVCPVLTQCERLKLKNSLAAQRTGQSSVWFHPRCDPITGHWSPIQCLRKQPAEMQTFQHTASRAFANVNEGIQSENGVCWCADKKGAPLKGTLTRDTEPVCNHRQARARIGTDDLNAGDLLMEELIRQMTTLIDNDENSIIDEVEVVEPQFETTELLQVGNSIKELEAKRLNINSFLQHTTRCMAIKKTATFPVACDENGGFVPTQCNEDECWCVDGAGNQLPTTGTFKLGKKVCPYTPIDRVDIQLVLTNKSKRSIINVYDILKHELSELLGYTPENIRVQENSDGSVLLKFELHNNNKIDAAFAIEEMIKRNDISLGKDLLTPELTSSRFIYQSQLPPPVAEANSSFTDNPFQTVVFIVATASAFLVSILVVFIMLKRGKKKMISSFPDNRINGIGDKYLDFSSPIFVLSANEKCELKTSDNELKTDKSTS